MPKGYDNIPALFVSCLDIPMFEAVGTLAHDIARANPLDHTMALHGGTIAWVQIAPSNLTVIDFTPATPDWLDLSAAESADLDYQAGDFSTVAWIYIDDLTNNCMLFCRGFVNTDGWEVAILSDGSIILYTFQAGANQYTQSAFGEVALNTWYMVGTSRSGAVAHLYKNGLDVTVTAGAHVNPAASARELHIGIYDNETGSPWAGRIWRPRIFGRQLSADDMRDLFEMERSLFGV